MLKKMILTNFLSFKNATTFDFTSTKYEILDWSNVAKNEILKGAFFIGPNASGKSNALLGIRFLLDFLLGEDMSIHSYLCLFGKSSMILEYDFEIEFTDFKYIIEYDPSKSILEEHLYINNDEILNRIGTNATIVLDVKISDSNVDQNTSYLRRASFETGKFPQNKYLNSFIEFISNSRYIDVHSLQSFRNMTLNRYLKENGADKINEYLEILHYDFKLGYESKASGEGLTIDAGDNKICFFMRDSFKIPIPIHKESLGNRILTNLLPGLINTIEKSGMFIIDEFSSGLHNVLEEKIIRFFMENSNSSQLFFTSHSTNLVSNSIMRPDQIYIITFEGRDGSRAKRISDDRPREAQNIEKMYLSGVFEGIPNYDEQKI